MIHNGRCLRRQARACARAVMAVMILLIDDHRARAVASDPRSAAPLFTVIELTVLGHNAPRGGSHQSCSILHFSLSPAVPRPHDALLALVHLGLVQGLVLTRSFSLKRTWPSKKS